MPALSEVVLEFARELYGPSDVWEVAVEPLHGGLVSAGVSLVRVRQADGREIGAFVVKPMAGSAVREYMLHRELETVGCSAAAPRVLGSRAVDSGDLYVFLEWICCADNWPWRDAEYAAMVLDQLALVHGCDVARVQPLVSDWDFDQELRRSAEATVETYAQLFTAGFRVGPRPMLRPLERVCDAIIRMRHETMEFTGKALLHGDAHPGNAVIRAVNGSREAVLLDWARARIGSPLEDVTSWVHSLGFWEPAARRVHDSLLTRYLQARGSSGELTSAFRSASWLAGSCNAMAGALRYHLFVAADEQRNEVERWESAKAAGDWLRIVRRADAVWRN